jgi:hypothetical protein
MSTEQNKALVRRLFEEGLNQNQPGVFDELLAPTFMIYEGSGHHFGKSVR